MVAIPDRLLRDAQAVAPDLWQVLVAIGIPESGGDSRAQGDWKLYWGGPIVKRETPGAFPTSFGYLQYHVDGGLGTGIDPEVLMDGPTNLRLGAQHIRDDLAAGKSLYEALWPWSTRDEAWSIYQQITDGQGVIDSAPAPVGGNGGQPATGGGNVPPIVQAIRRSPWPAFLLATVVILAFRPLGGR